MKLYNEKEIGSILKRAAELSHDDADTGSLGLSLEELKQLGKEAGINPDFILKAASEVGTRKLQTKEKNFFGGPVSYSSEMVLPREIDSRDWEEMLSKIRLSFKDPGIVTTRENIFEWTIQNMAAKAQVTARSENDQTRVQLFWAEPGAAVPFMIPTLIGTIISLPIIFEALNLSGFPGAMAVMATMSTLFFLGKFGVASYTARRSDKLDRLMTELELLVARNTPVEGKTKAKVVVKSSPKTPETNLLDATEGFEADEFERTPSDRTPSDRTRA